jgi:hypothetical protein
VTVCDLRFIFGYLRRNKELNGEVMCWVGPLNIGLHLTEQEPLFFFFQKMNKPNFLG